MSLQLQHELQSRGWFSAPSWNRAAVKTSSTYSRGRDYLHASSQSYCFSIQKPPRNGISFDELYAPKCIVCMKGSDHGSECCPSGYVDLSLTLYYEMCIKNFTLMCNYPTARDQECDGRFLTSPNRVVRFISSKSNPRGSCRTL